jgi:hypothetical protein
MDVVQFAKDNWAVISEAPWAFLAALLIGCAVGRFMYGQRIEDLMSRISHRDDQIKALETGRLERSEIDGGNF